jgi:trk system potassium uptake protein TrkH
MDPESGGGTWARRAKRFRLGLLATLATALPTLDVGGASPWYHGAGLALATLALALAALAEGRGGHGRSMVLVATGALFLGLHDQLISRPALALILGLGAVLLSARNTRPLPTGGLDLAEPFSLPAWGAMLPTLWVSLAVGSAPHPEPLAELAATATGLLASGLAVLSFYGVRTPRSWVRRLALAVWLGAIAAAAVALEDHGLRLMALALAAGTPVLADLFEARRGRPFASWADPIASRPALMLAVTFGVTAGVGAVLLWLPVSAGGGAISGIDAFFTAVSATCVTGLIVLDTPSAFSGFGQLVIFALIQVGGLGIMTFSTAALAVLRRRPSLRHERALTDLFVAKEGQDHVGAVKDVLKVTVATELLGAAALTALFAARHGDDLGAALWRGLFTSVSAFCNAGFALQSDSLMPYAEDPWVLYTIAALITVGGLGPVATLAARDLIRRRSISIAVRLIFLTSAALTLGGALLIAAFEWQSSLHHLGVVDRLHNAIFQSVTLRTAGFNSVDFTLLRPETQILMLPFMLVGGSPGSTAGGIKTTTFAVVLLSMVAVIRGRPEALVKKRRIEHATFYRAVAITTLGLSSAFGLWMLVVLTQAIDPLSAVFEAFSAVGTVGVSVGATGRLDDVGKLLVAAGMFAGRLGPLTLLLLFAARRRPPPFTHPEVGVPVG